MIKYGCLARFFNNYEYEINFAKANNFDFMQLWYDNGGLYVDKQRNAKIESLKAFKFPSIVHAVLDINDFEIHIPIIKNILKELEHTELIIHPICESEEITEGSIKKLNEKIRYSLEYLGKEITIFLENNSKNDPIFQKVEEINYIFKENPKAEFVLDIAHMDSYQDLEALVKIKMPKILHLADKHFNVTHEHLPVGKGEINFKKVFGEILDEFSGKIIFEIIQNDEDIVKSKDIIKLILEEF